MRARLMEEAIAAEAKAVRRDEREDTARGSKGERKRSEETLTKASAKEDWQAMVVPDPAKGGDRSTFRDLRRYP